MTDLPIHAVLPDLLAALRGGTSAVLIAPPGAGKTTSVATALLDQPWCSGSVILLSPRRVAARAAAERMAELLGEAPGETVGYLTRLDSKRSARTRVLVMTEAIFVSTILNDPELSGVSAVLFDEAHERHLDSDLGLALAIESQQVLRPELRLVVMSATIDGARFAGLLGDAPVVESEGKAHPLTIRWLGARPDLRIEEAMTSAILTAWREETGDILAFLPGVGEIERVRERLADKLPAALVLPLHGQCEPAAQRAAIRRDPQGRRRIVLATAIAETSLTLDGVSVVVDAGLSRRAEYDKAAGVTRLVTHRASQAAMESEDLAGWQEHNLRFHELIYGATRNPYLRQEVLLIRARTGFYRRHAFGALGRVRASFDQHAEIVRAFEQADPQAAVRAMSGHMRPDQGGGSITDFVANLPPNLLAA